MRPSNALVLAAALTLSACGLAPQAKLVAGTPSVEMRTWEMAPGQAERLVSSLNRVMTQRRGDESHPVGKAVEGPGGALVVVAPAGVLEGVEALVSRVESSPPPPAPQNVEMEYWVVFGDPSAPAGRGPGLDELGAALTAIEAADGVQAFTLRTARSLQTLDGRRGMLEDRDLGAFQTVSVEPGTDTVLADIDVSLPVGGSKVETELALMSGEIAVLSQTGVRTPEAANVYLLVRPTVR